MTAIYPYDTISADQVVGAYSPTDQTERWASAQPPGWVADRIGDTWRLSLNEVAVGLCHSLDEIEESIAYRHNTHAAQLLDAAENWAEYYHDHPEDRAAADPGLIASIYLSAGQDNPDDD